MSISNSVLSYLGANAVPLDVLNNITATIGTIDLVQSFGNLAIPRATYGFDIVQLRAAIVLNVERLTGDNIEAAFALCSSLAYLGTLMSYSAVARVQDIMFDGEYYAPSVIINTIGLVSGYSVVGRVSWNQFIICFAPQVLYLRMREGVVIQTSVTLDTGVVVPFVSDDYDPLKFPQAVYLNVDDAAALAALNAFLVQLQLVTGVDVRPLRDSLVVNGHDPDAIYPRFTYTAIRGTLTP